MIRDGKFSEFNRFMGNMNFIVQEKRRQKIANDGVTFAELMGITLLAVDEIKLMVWLLAHQLHAIQWEWAHSLGTIMAEGSGPGDLAEYERIVNRMAPIKKRLDAITGGTNVGEQST